MIEPKTKLETGVWFKNEDARFYKGTLPVVIQYNKKSPEHMVEPYLVSRCPPCDRERLPQSTIKRWLILPE